MAVPARTFFRIDEEDILADSDIVVMLLADDGDMIARLRTPEWAWSEPMMPRVAFISALEHLDGATYRAELVVIDVDRLWKSNWGELLDHPTRAPRGR